MRRLFLIIGLMWGAIFIANHLVLPGHVSNGAVEPHKPLEQVTVSRQIDSWGWKTCLIAQRSRRKALMKNR